MFPNKKIPDDTKRAAALKLASDVQAKLETATKAIIADADLDWEDKVELVSLLKTQVAWARDLHNRLDQVFVPSEPEP